MLRTLVRPDARSVFTMPARSKARCAAFALILATASALPTCLPLSARAPLGLPSLTPRAFAAASAVRVSLS
jgi:hypothetical protein